MEVGEDVTGISDVRIVTLVETVDLDVTATLDGMIGVVEEMTEDPLETGVVGEMTPDKMAVQTGVTNRGDTEMVLVGHLGTLGGQTGEDGRTVDPVGKTEMIVDLAGVIEMTVVPAEMTEKIVGLRETIGMIAGMTEMIVGHVEMIGITGVLVERTEMTAGTGGEMTGAEDPSVAQTRANGGTVVSHRGKTCKGNGKQRMTHPKTLVKVSLRKLTRMGGRQ